MKSVLAKQVRLQFERGLRERIPNARRLEARLLPSGWPGWLVGENDSASAYVILAISPRADRFTIELAWSLERRLPDFTRGELGVAGRDREARFRISRLWEPSGGSLWYDLQSDADFPATIDYDVFAPDEPSLARIPEKIRRALEALDSYGLPYLRTIGGPLTGE